jgi:cell division septation protein DedD
LYFAQARKASIDDLLMQLEFLWEELQAYKDVMKVLKKASSIKEASNAVLTGYEKPADQSNAVKNKRAGFGKEYYDRFAEGSRAAEKVSRGYFVQFGAFGTKNNAKKRLYEVQSKGLEGSVEKFDGYYRVFDGYFGDVSEANEVAAKARKAGFNVLIKERKD